MEHDFAAVPSRTKLGSESSDKSLISVKYLNCRMCVHKQIKLCLHGNKNEKKNRINGTCFCSSDLLLSLFADTIYN